MPRAIILNTDQNTIKRLWLEDDGRATLQCFGKERRDEIHLTAEEWQDLLRLAAQYDGHEPAYTYEMARQDLASATPRMAAQFDTENAQRVAAALDADEKLWKRLGRESEFLPLDLDDGLLDLEKQECPYEHEEQHTPATCALCPRLSEVDADEERWRRVDRAYRASQSGSAHEEPADGDLR